MSDNETKVIFDNIHGYIKLNRVESRILETPYYQRLRWIKQLGFSFYIFPGATHTRHAHALGVLHVMDRILNSIGHATPDEKSNEEINSSVLILMKMSFNFSPSNPRTSKTINAKNGECEKRKNINNNNSHNNIERKKPLFT